MSYSLTMLNRVISGLERGSLIGLIKGILGVWAIAHVGT